MRGVSEFGRIQLYNCTSRQDLALYRYEHTCASVFYYRAVGI